MKKKFKLVRQPYFVTFNVTNRWKKLWIMSHCLMGKVCLVFQSVLTVIAVREINKLLDKEVQNSPIERVYIWVTVLFFYPMLP